jgi:hypothetical protein
VIFTKPLIFFVGLSGFAKSPLGNFIRQNCKFPSVRCLSV